VDIGSSPFPSGNPVQYLDTLHEHLIGRGKGYPEVGIVLREDTARNDEYVVLDGLFDELPRIFALCLGEDVKCPLGFLNGIFPPQPFIDEIPLSSVSLDQF